MENRYIVFSFIHFINRHRRVALSYRILPLLLWLVEDHKMNKWSSGERITQDNSCPHHALHYYLGLPGSHIFSWCLMVGKISDSFKDTFLARHTYFWPMQNEFVYLGIVLTKFQTTAIVRWGVIAQWSAFHFMYHASHFPMSQPTAAKVNLCALEAWALGFA